MEWFRAEPVMLLLLAVASAYFFARTLFLSASRDHWRLQAQARMMAPDVSHLLIFYNKGVLDLTSRLLAEEQSEHVPAAIRSYNEGVLYLLRACNESGGMKYSAIANASGQAPDCSSIEPACGEGDQNPSLVLFKGEEGT